VFVVVGMSQYKVVVVERNIKEALDNLLKGGPLFIAILVIIFICLYNVMKIIIFYMKETKNHEANQKRLMMRLKGPNLGTNEYKNTKLDEYIDEGKDEKLDDEYSRMTQTIQKSLSEYKDYNQKLSSFYESTKNTTIPDKIDATILSMENDNY
jgi:hypothetical protein